MSNKPETGATAALAEFAATLQTDRVPEPVYGRITDLFVDWAGSCLSGKGHRAVEIIADFSRDMGKDGGPAEVLINRTGNSPFFAAMVNAAASHISEQDDVHNGSVFHPATVVFPAALATAQAIGANGRSFLAACVAGYETGIRVGEALGLSHYRVFHTTGTAGTFAAAAAVARLLGLNPANMLHAFGSAGTQSAGLWEFLRDGADSKQLHTAKAACDGLMSAWVAKSGFTGARAIVEGPQGLAAGTSHDFNPERLTDRLGERWTVLETSFKFHASCRHTHPAADALVLAMQENGLNWQDVARVTCHVHQAAIDVLGPVKVPATVHQAKFCMAATLGLLAVHGRAGLAEFAQVLSDRDALSFLDRIEMKLDPEVEQTYPARWIGKVTVEIKTGQTFMAWVDEPKGDPGNPLSREEIDHKARNLALSSNAVCGDELDALMHTLWQVGKADRMGILLGSGSR